MRTREEVENRLNEIKEEEEELKIEFDIYKSYDILEEIVGDIVKEIKKGLSLTGITVNLWRIEDCNADDNDWSLTANYVDMDNNIDIEKECKDLYDELLERGFSTDDILEIKEYKNRYVFKDLLFEIEKIIENLVNQVIEELSKR